MHRPNRSRGSLFFLSLLRPRESQQSHPQLSRRAAWGTPPTWARFPHSWLGTEGWGEGGSGRVGGRGVQLGGRPPAKGLTFLVCGPAPPTQESPSLLLAPRPASCTRRPDLLEFQHKGNPRPQEVHHEERGTGGGERGMLPSLSTPPPSRSPGQPWRNPQGPPFAPGAGRIQTRSPPSPPSLQPPARYQQWWVASALSSHHARAPRRRGLELPLARLTHLFASPLLSFRVRQHLGLRLFFCP